MPELWAHILNGADPLGVPLLDPSMRPWAAMVCRAWHGIIRSPSLDHAHTLQRLAPKRYPARDERAERLWVEGRLLCATSLVALLRRLDLAQAASVCTWVARLVDGAHAHMITLSAVASDRPALVDHLVGRKDVWNRAVASLDATVRDLDSRGYDSLWGAWIHPPDDVRDTYLNVSYDVMGQNLLEVALYVACRHGSLYACRHLVPQFARAIRPGGPFHQTLVEGLEIDREWILLWRRATQGPSPHIVCLLLYALFAILSPRAVDPHLVAAMLCNDKGADLRRRNKHMLPWSEHVADTVLQVAHDWTMGSRTTLPYAVSIQAIVESTVRAIHAAHTDSMDQVVKHSSIVVSGAKEEQATERGDDVRRLLWGRALYAVLTVDEVHELHVQTGSMSLLRALDQRGIGYRAASLFGTALYLGHSTVCEYLWHTHRAQIASTWTPKALVAQVFDGARIYYSATYARLVGWLHHTVTAAPGMEDTGRLLVEQVQGLFDTAADDFVRVDDRIPFPVALLWPKLCLPMAARLILSQADGRMRRFDALLVAFESIAASSAHNERPDLWAHAADAIRAASTRHSRYDQHAGTVGLFALARMARRTGHVSVPLPLLGGRGRLRRLAPDDPNSIAHTKASPALLRRWCHVRPLTVAQLGLAPIAQLCSNADSYKRHEPQRICRVVWWLVEHGLVVRDDDALALCASAMPLFS